MKDKPDRRQKIISSLKFWHFNLELDRYTAAPLLPGPRAGGALARMMTNCTMYRAL